VLPANAQDRHRQGVSSRGCDCWSWAGILGNQVSGGEHDVSNVPSEESVLSAGVLANGNIVGVPVHDDRARAEIVEAMLQAKLRAEIFNVAPDARFRTWINRGEIVGPAGELLHARGWRLNFSIKGEISRPLRNIIDSQPNTFHQLELWCQPWSDEPPENI
jgi:hypothetical protein